MTPAIIVLYPGEPENGEAAEEMGKFLQFTFRGQEYLAFAPIEVHRYHTQILARFLEEQGVVHHWIGDDKLVVDDPDFRVIGGGRYQIRPGQARLDLWDNSQVYGRFDEAGLKQKIAAAGHAWSGYKVTIR